MQRQKQPPLYEWLSFSFDHWIIFWTGIIVIVAITLYVLWNIKKVPIGIFIESISLTIASWFLFYLTLTMEKSETMTAVVAIMGSFLPIITFFIVKFNKKI